MSARQLGANQGIGESIRQMSPDSLLDIHISMAAKYEQKSSDAPASVTIITADHIKHYGY